jgi:transcriptional antiterminator Rof (Rho-off)
MEQEQGAQDQLRQAKIAKSSMHSEYAMISCDTHHFVAAAETYIVVCQFRDSVNLALHVGRLRARLLCFQRARANHMCLKAAQGWQEGFRVQHSCKEGY